MEPYDVYFDLCRQLSLAGAPRVTFTTWRADKTVPNYTLGDLFRLLEAARDRWFLRIERQVDGLYWVLIWRSGEDLSTRSSGQGTTPEIAVAWAIFLAIQGCKLRNEAGFFRTDT